MSERKGLFIGLLATLGIAGVGTAAVTAIPKAARVAKVATVVKPLGAVRLSDDALRFATSEDYRAFLAVPKHSEDAPPKPPEATAHGESLNLSDVADAYDVFDKLNTLSDVCNEDYGPCADSEPQLDPELLSIIEKLERGPR